MHHSTSKPRQIKKWLLGSILVLLALLPLACNTTEGTDFKINYVDRDSLTQFDSIVVLLERDGSSRADTLFKGKLEDPDDLKNLPVPGDLTGKFTITVKGIMNGEVALERSNEVDADKKTLVGSEIKATPKGKIQFDTTSLVLKVGDTANLPKITIAPEEWKDKEVVYAFQEIKVLAIIAQSKVVGLFRGTAKIIAFLKDAPHVSDTLSVQVLDAVADKIQVKVSPDTLRLAAEGAAGSLRVETVPAYKPVTWYSADTSIATVDASGLVRGKREGRIWITARAQEDTTSADSAWVAVAAPVSVASVAFTKETLVLFVGGASDTVGVTVLPKDADQATGLRVIGRAVNLVNRSFIPVDTGSATAIVYSLRDTTKTDTLAITVKKAQAVSAYSVKPDTLKLYLGGPAMSFNITIEPSAAGKFTVWRFANPALARANDTGLVTALNEGFTTVEALSLADSSRRDTVSVMVIRDVPKLTVGTALAVSPGKEVVFEPKVEQAFGGIASFHWDLDGDSTYEDSSESLETVKKTYSEIGEVTARFKVVDGEGNEAFAQRVITITKGPLVEILEPVDGFVTKASTVTVNWQVDGVKQEKLTQEALTQDGPKTITRSAKDAAGNETVISITVFRDTKAPERPVVNGKTPTSTKNPAFSWRGGGGGAGIFRYQIDAEPGEAQANTTDTLLTWPTDLTPGTHTLFVQERDTAGNWSASGQRRIVIDLVAPEAPEVAVVGGATTNKSQVTFTWQGSVDEGAPVYQYMLNKSVFDPTAVTVLDTTVTLILGEGAHTLYVRQLDSAGNASLAGSASVSVDTTAPGKPSLRSATGAYSTNGRPTWIWKTGGGQGRFRSRLDTADLSSKTFTTDTLFTPASVLSEGPHTLYVQERDSVGNVSPIETLTVIVDTQKPAAAVCSEPLDNAWVATRTPTWKWSQVAGGDGRFYVFIAGQYTPDTASRITATSFTSPVNLPDGLNTMGIRAYDAAGNASDLVTCRLRVDVTPPPAPTPSTPFKHVNDVTPTRAFHANSTTGLSLRVRFDNADVAGGVVLPFATLGSYTSTTDLAEGRHIFYAQVLDSAGNASPVMADTFFIDVTPPAAPVLTVLQPSISVRCAGDAAANLVSRSNQAGLLRVEYAWNDSAMARVTVTQPTQTNFSLTSGGCLDAGINHLYVREMDSAGNVSPIVRSAAIVALPGVDGNNVETFDVNPKPDKPNIDFKIAGGSHYAAYIGPNAEAGVSTAQVAVRSGFGAAWTNIQTPFSYEASDVRLAVDPARKQFTVANINSFAVQISTYIDGKWLGVSLPSLMSREQHSWFAMDYSDNGQLYIAFSDVVYDGALTVCLVEGEKCTIIGDRGFNKSRVNHVFLTAKPSLLVAVRNSENLPEVFGLPSEEPGAALVRLETGMEKSTTHHFGFGVVKNTVGLMYFSSLASPVYQLFSYEGRWQVEKPIPLPETIGIGLGVMDVGPNGRPFLAMPSTGQLWGLDNGAWKSLRTLKYDFTKAWGIDLKVEGTGIPFIITSPEDVNHRVFRLGFDLPHLSLPQP